MKDYKNSKWQLVIERDGRIKGKQMLSIEDKRKREELIASHFLAFYEKTYRVKVPKDLIERDNPQTRHDFTYTNKVGDKLYIEIVSISDTSDGFRKQNNEKLLSDLLKDCEYSVVAFLPPETTKKQLFDAVHEMNKHEPIKISDFDPENLLNERINVQHAVIRRLNDKQKKRIYTTDGVNESAETIINGAIKKKEAEDYLHIQEMVLIIDNQIIEYGIENIGQFLPAIAQQNIQSPFREIFIYTGFFGDKGHVSSFNIIPIKCDRDPNIRLQCRTKAE